MIILVKRCFYPSRDFLLSLNRFCMATLMAIMSYLLFSHLYWGLMSIMLKDTCKTLISLFFNFFMRSGCASCL